MNTNDLEAATVYDAVGISIEPRAEFRTEMERRICRKWGDGASTWTEGSCKICGRRLDVARDVIDLLGVETVFVYGCCDDCTEVRDAHYRRSTEPLASVSRTPWWDENCPALYRDLLAADELPEGIRSPDALKRVLDWVPQAGGRGLIITGESGAGKTTAMWGLARTLEEKQYGVVLLTAVELQRQLSEAARDIKGVKHLTHCRVLMVDDLGKEKLTASVAALLWEVVDSRYANRRPMVLTTRYGGAAFEARFGDNVLGIDIRRRIMESCDRVMFSATQTK
jgi:hypothetical protein